MPRSRFQIQKLYQLVCTKKSLHVVCLPSASAFLPYSFVQIKKPYVSFAEPTQFFYFNSFSEVFFLFFHLLTGCLLTACMICNLVPKSLFIFDPHDPASSLWNYKTNTAAQFNMAYKALSALHKHQIQPKKVLNCRPVFNRKRKDSNQKYEATL